MSFVPNSRNSVTLKDVRQSRALILMLPLLRLVLITTQHAGLYIPPVESFIFQAGTLFNDPKIHNLMYNNPTVYGFGLSVRLSTNPSLNS